MKAELKTTFDHYGKYVTGHIEDAEMYRKVKNGIAYWKETVISRITHIRIPKEVFERLLELDRNAINNKQSEGEWVDQYNGKYDNPIYVCSVCRRGTLLKPYIDNLGNMKMEQALSEFCPRCGAKMIVTDTNVGDK